MSDQAGSLQILIDVRSKLDELVRSQEAFRKTREEAQGFGNMLKTGFGIDLARRGLDLLTNSLRQSVGEAFRMAGAIKDQAENLGISTDAYQVLGAVLKDAGGNMELLTQLISQSNRSLAEARGLSGAAAGAYRTLGLDPAQLEGLAVEERLERIGRALMTARDQTAAYGAAAQLVGTRNLPLLMNALRTLAGEGYGALEAAAKRAGLVMERDTIQTLDRAQKQIEKVQRQLAIQLGKDVGGLLAEDPSFFSDTAGQVFRLFDVLVRRPVQGMGSLAANAMNFAEGRGFTFLDEANKRERDAQNFADRALAIKEASERKMRADAAAAEAKQKNTLADAELGLAKASLQRQEAESANFGEEAARRDALRKALLDELAARQKLIDVSKSTPSPDETAQQRALRLAQLESAQRVTASQVYGMQPSAYGATVQRYLERDRPENGIEGVSAGLRGGAMEWVTQTGTVGDQVANGLQNSIGTTVRGISDAIRGWAVGARDFGDIALQVGDSLLSTLLETLVQMGAQWLINAALAKGSLISTFLVAVGLRKAETADVIANETAKAPAIQANAAGASISSFGIAAAVGIAALLAAMALFRGFSAGGYTGSGGIDEPAGIVHAGEVVWSQADVARSGGVAAVESLRVGGAAVARPINAASLSLSSAVGAAGSAAAKPARLIAIVPDLHSARALQRDPAFENVIVDVMQRRRGDLLG